MDMFADAMDGCFEDARFEDAHASVTAPDRASLYTNALT